MTKLVILDRDGVINYDSPHYIKSAEEWQALPGSLAAIAKLNTQGYKVAVASNQSGIGRGLFNRDALEAMHTKLQQQLAAEGGHIDYFAICPHHPAARCQCRKPLPGLLWQISRYFDCDLVDVPIIGDSLRDVEAAQAVRGQPILVLTGNGADTLQQLSLPLAIKVYPDLAAAVDVLVAAILT